MVDRQPWVDDAITALFSREYTRLVRAAVLLVGDVETAEDVVQDAFVAVHRRWARITDPERVGGYLHRAVVNGSRSVLRHRAVVHRHAGSLAEPENTADAADLVLARAARAAVLDALAALPRRQREVLVLRHYLGLSEAEIASTLRISTGSVKTHASRGAAALRTRLRKGDLR
jgi:RNA polymerase sigma-70 factor (sigma-E family)